MTKTELLNRIADIQSRLEDLHRSTKIMEHEIHDIIIQFGDIPDEPEEIIEDKEE